MISQVRRRDLHIQKTKTLLKHLDRRNDTEEAWVDCLTAYVEQMQGDDPGYNFSDDPLLVRFNRETSEILPLGFTAEGALVLAVERGCCRAQPGDDQSAIAGKIFACDWDAIKAASEEVGLPDLILVVPDTPFFDSTEDWRVAVNEWIGT